VFAGRLVDHAGLRLGDFGVLSVVVYLRFEVLDSFVVGQLLQHVAHANGRLLPLVTGHWNEYGLINRAGELDGCERGCEGYHHGNDGLPLVREIIILKREDGYNQIVPTPSPQ
jgi:hypothetical protein